MIERIAEKSEQTNKQTIRQASCSRSSVLPDDERRTHQPTHLGAVAADDAQTVVAGQVDGARQVPSVPAYSVLRTVTSMPNSSRQTGSTTCSSAAIPFFTPPCGFTTT